MIRVGRSVAALALAGVTLAVAAVVSLSPADAERTRRPYRIGVLNDARAANHPAVDGLKGGLRGLGLQEGRDVVFEVALTGADAGRVSAAAEALVGARADLIFTSGESATRAARDATRTIPIVFTVVGDPVGAGIVSSLADPGGNVTGVSGLATELVAKRLEALKALAPRLRRVWLIHGVGDLGVTVTLARAREAAAPLGLEIMDRTVASPDQLEAVASRAGPEDGLLVPDLGLMDAAAMLLEASLLRHAPAVFSSTLWVSHGGLIAYGADYRAQGIQAARLVAKILRGAHPRDLPVEGADHVVLAVNLKTAATFGLVAPRTLLYRADVLRR